MLLTAHALLQIYSQIAALAKHGSTSHSTVYEPVIAPAPLMRHPRRQGRYNSVALKTPEQLQQIFFRATT